MQEESEVITPEDLDRALLNDPALATCAGPEAIDQMRYLRIIEDYLEQFDIRYPHLPQFALEDHSWLQSLGPGADENFNRLVSHFHDLTMNFDVCQRTVFVTALTVYDSAVLAALLATERITSQEFAVIYLTSQCLNSKIFGTADDSFDSVRGQERQLLVEAAGNVDLMIRYLKQFGPEVERLIRDGESTEMEFKSTMRWNLRSDREDPAIEHAVLKSVAAFLNTNGGTLLVGVADDRAIVGIEADHFSNPDKCLLHFGNLVNSRIGREFADLLSYQLLPIRDKMILRVDCRRSPKPAFVKTSKEEQFFVRTGPSTIQLSTSEVLDYFAASF